MKNKRVACFSPKRETELEIVPKVQVEEKSQRKDKFDGEKKEMFKRFEQYMQNSFGKK